MITLKNIKKTYPNGFTALKGIDLQVKKGDIFGIVGYSGAGKSSLIRIINRLEEPTSGELIVDGENVLSYSPRQLQLFRQKVGMIFQHFNLLSARNVFENVAFALEIAKWERDKIKPRVLELLDLVGLSDKKNFYPSQLSGGQKQRVAIARALANHPKILLCDEATSALDVKTTKSILELLKSIQSRLGLTIVLITHQIEVVKSICNKICVIEAGEIVESGDVGSVFSNALHPTTAELLAHLPTNKDVFSHVSDFKNLYHLIFFGKAQNSPLISEAIKQFGVEINILFAELNDLSNTSFGHMIAELRGDRLSDALLWLEENLVSVQFLGDYARTHFSIYPRDSRDNANASANQADLKVANA
ncbi:MAG: ATP-binding cassette domain-containing protein [Helicobacter sp.]|nr:ATP-binding cassette domain-containing protein [Helicobacter sp.]